jgi:peptidoglycan/LPS O-acetylase OafA/YrhL
MLVILVAAAFVVDELSRSPALFGGGGIAPQAFPAILLFLYLKANSYKTVILGFLCSARLVACVVLPYRKPEWAFYLLPTRAWELMAESIIANFSAHRPAAEDKKLLWTSLSLAGVALIIISLFSIHDGALGLLK